jgi:hypothetical protein
MAHTAPSHAQSPSGEGAVVPWHSWGTGAGGLCAPRQPETTLPFGSGGSLGWGYAGVRGVGAAGEGEGGGGQQLG